MQYQDIAGIPGWFYPTDFTLFDWFLTQQEATEPTGDLAELGVYMGRSAVVIGAHTQQDETFTVIDVFEDPNASADNAAENRVAYAGFTREAFERNYRRHLLTLPVVIADESAKITDHASHGQHRFVHVDASHLYDLVAADIRAAKVLLRDDGLIVLDDIRSIHTPGVWAAVWEAVVTGGLNPIVVTEGKMYATWGDPADWQARIRESTPHELEFEEQRVLGRPLYRAWVRPRPRPWHDFVVSMTPPALLSLRSKLRH